MSSLPDPNQLLIYALAFLRIGAIVFALPLFGDSPVPVRVRTILTVALTFGLSPLIPAGWAPNLQVDVLVIANYVLRELMVGLVIGFMARIAFDGLVMAASVVAYQMGFGTGAMFMPDFGDRMDAFTALHRYLVLLIFLTLNLHHVFFFAMLETFRAIPAAGMSMPGGLAILMTQSTANILSISLQLAAPVLVALLFAMAALGLVARAVPQFNVFVMSFPISFCLGLIVYIATLPFYPEWLRVHFEANQSSIFSAIRLMAQ